MSTATVRVTGNVTQALAALEALGIKAETTAAKTEGAFAATAERTGNVFSKLGSSLASWGIPFSGSLTTVGSKIAEADTKAAKFSQTMAGIGKLTIAAGLAGFAVVATEAVRGAKDFTAAMEQIHTQAGASQGEVAKMTKGVLGLRDIVQSPEDLAVGLYHLESTGLRGARALKALKIAAEGAGMGQANLEDVTNAMNATIASGIPGARNLTAAMGALNGIVGSGDMHMQDLAEALGTGVLASVKGFGLTLNDVGAALATFGDNNIRGSNAATQLRMAVQAFAKPARDAATILPAMGLSVDKLGKDMQSGGLQKALTDLHDHMQRAGLTGAKVGATLTDAFGKKAGVGINVLIGQYGRFESKTKEVSERSKGFTKDYAAYQQTLQAQLGEFRHTVESVGTSFGIWLIPKLNQAAKAIASGIEWMKKHQDVAKALGATIGGFLALAVGATLVNAFAKAIGSIKDAIGAVSSFVKAIPGAVSAVAEFASGFANYARVVALGFADMVKGAAVWAASTARSAAVAAASMVKSVAMSIKAGAVWAAEHAALAASFIAENVAMAASATAAFIAENLATLGIVAGIAALIAGIVYLATHWRQTWDVIKKVGNAAWDWMKGAVADVVGWIKGHWELLVGILTGPIGLAVAEIVKHWHKIKDTVVNVFNDIVSFLQGLPGQLEQIGIQIIQGLYNGIKSQLDGVKNMVTGLGHDILSAIKSPLGIFSPSREMDKVGKAIMDGLNNGIESRHGNLKQKLKIITADVATLDGAISNATQWGQSFLGNVFTAGLASSGVTPGAKSSSTVGGANITQVTAATQGMTGPALVTAMLNYEQQQATQADQIKNAVAKLRKEHLSASLLSQLASGGTAALPEILALAGATPQQIAQINALDASQTASINQAGAVATTGHSMHQLQVADAHAKAIEKGMEKAIKKTGLHKKGSKLRKSA